MINLGSTLLLLEQEAMENFVFPDEIKTKMMKIDKTWNGGKRNYKKHEAMENFVFPDEIDQTKLIKMNEEHFFMFPKIMQKCSKLYAFSLILF